MTRMQHSLEVTNEYRKEQRDSGQDVTTSPHAWKEHTLCKRGNGNDDNNDQTGLVTEELETLNQVETVNQIELHIQPNTWVSCVYEHNWYIGHVENVDNDDNEVEVNFLERSGKYGKVYQWPTRPDKIWIPRTDILTVLQEPRPAGKTKHMYQMDQTDIENVEKIFDQLKQTFVSYECTKWIRKTLKMLIKHSIN